MIALKLKELLSTLTEAELYMEGVIKYELKELLNSSGIEYVFSCFCMLMTW